MWLAAKVRAAHSPSPPSGGASPEEETSPPSWSSSLAARFKAGALLLRSLSPLQALRWSSSSVWRKSAKSRPCSSTLRNENSRKTRQRSPPSKPQSSRISIARRAVNEARFQTTPSRQNLLRVSSGKFLGPVEREESHVVAELSTLLAQVEESHPIPEELSRNGVMRVGLPLEAIAMVASRSSSDAKQVLSCMSHLCEMGLTSQLAAESSLRDLVVDSLLACRADKLMPQYVLPVTFHLCETVPMLRSLSVASKEVIPVLKTCRKRRSVSVQHKRYAKSVLANLKAHKHAEREQKHDISAAARALAYGIGDPGSLLPKVLREDIMKLNQRSRQQPQRPLIYDIRIVRI